MKKGAKHPGGDGNLFTCASYNTAFYRLRGATGKSSIYKKGNIVGEVYYGVSSCSTLNETVAVHRALGNNLNKKFSEAGIAYFSLIRHGDTQTAG
jgi:hypothetical protein